MSLPTVTFNSSGNLVVNGIEVTPFGYWSFGDYPTITWNELTDTYQGRDAVWSYAYDYIQNQGAATRLHLALGGASGATGPMMDKVRTCEPYSSVYSWVLPEEPWTYGWTSEQVNGLANLIRLEDSGSRPIAIVPSNNDAQAGYLADVTGTMDYGVIQAGYCLPTYMLADGFITNTNAAKSSFSKPLFLLMRINGWQLGRFRFARSIPSHTYLRCQIFLGKISGYRGFFFWPYGYRDDTESIIGIEPDVYSYNGFWAEGAEIQGRIANLGQEIETRKTLFLSNPYLSGELSITSSNSDVKCAVFNVGGLPQVVAVNIKESTPTTTSEIWMGGSAQLVKAQLEYASLDVTGYKFPTDAQLDSWDFNEEIAINYESQVGIQHITFPYDYYEGFWSPFDEGTGTVSTNKVTDVSKNWNSNEFVGRRCVIKDTVTHVHTSYTITGNSATQLTLGSSPPSGSKEYMILDDPDLGVPFTREYNTLNVWLRTNDPSPPVSFNVEWYLFRDDDRDTLPEVLVDSGVKELSVSGDFQSYAITTNVTLVDTTCYMLVITATETSPSLLMPYRTASGVRPKYPVGPGATRPTLSSNLSPAVQGQSNASTFTLSGTLAKYYKWYRLYNNTTNVYTTGRISNQSFTVSFDAYDSCIFELQTGINIHGYESEDAREVWWYGYDGNIGQGQTTRTYAGVLPKMYMSHLGKGADSIGPAIDYLKEFLDSGFFAAQFQWSDAFPGPGHTGIYVGTGSNPEALHNYLARTQTPAILFEASFGYYTGTVYYHPCGIAPGTTGACTHIGNQEDCPGGAENPTKALGLRFKYEPDPVGASGTYAYWPHAPWSCIRPNDTGHLDYYYLSALDDQGWEDMGRNHWYSAQNTYGATAYNFLTNLGCKVVGWWSDWEDIYTPCDSSSGDSIKCFTNSPNGRTGISGTMREICERDDRFNFPNATGWNMDPFYKSTQFTTRALEARGRAVEKIANTWPDFDPNYASLYDIQAARNEFLTYDLECTQAYGRPKHIIQPYAWYGFGSTYIVFIATPDDYNFIGLQYFTVSREIIRAIYKNCHNFDIWWCPCVNASRLGTLDNPLYGYSLTIAQSIGFLKECMALGAIKLLEYNPEYTATFGLWAMAIAYDEMQPYHEFIKSGINYIPPAGIMRPMRERYNTDSGSHTSTMRDCAFSPVTRMYATVSADLTCKIWDYSTRHRITSITLPYSPFSVAWSTGEVYLAVGYLYSGPGSQVVVEIYNSSDFSLHRNISDLYTANDIVFLGDSRIAIAQGGNIKIYSVATGDLLTTLEFSESISVFALDISPDDAYIVASGTGDNGSETVWWTIDDFSERGRVYHPASNSYVESLEFDASSSKLLVAFTNIVEIWTIVDSSIEQYFTVTDLNDASYNSDGTQVVTCSADYHIQIWDISGAPMIILDIPITLTNFEHHNQMEYASKVRFSYDDSFIAALLRSHYTYCYSTTTGERIAGLSGYDLEIIDFHNSTPFWGTDYYGNEIPEKYWICCRILGEQVLFFGLTDGTETAIFDINSPANTKVSVEVSPTGSITIV